MKDILLLTAVLVLVIWLDRLGRNKRRLKRRTKLIFTTFINNSQIKILAMTIDKKQFANTILSLVDSDTGAIILATFSNVVLTSSDTNIFTADTDVNNDAQVDIVGVNEGTATLTVEADATYVDANTGQEVTTPEKATVDVSVTLPPPGPQNTNLVVSFSNPQPV